MHTNTIGIHLMSHRQLLPDVSERTDSEIPFLTLDLRSLSLRNSTEKGNSGCEHFVAGFPSAVRC